MALGLPKDVLVNIKGKSVGLEAAASRSQAVLRRVGATAASTARAVAGIGAAAAGIGFAIKRGLVDPFAEEEQAVISLNQALASTGKAGQQALGTLRQEASRLQSVTVLGDEAIIKATASLSAMAPALDVPALKLGQTTIIGLSEAMGTDLDSAARLLAKTLGSSTNALSRYGIEVDVTASESEKLAQITAQLGPSFDVAKSKADSISGRLQQLGNVAGDLRETLGEVVARTTGLAGGSDRLKDRIIELNSRIRANMDRWVAWSKVGLESVKAVGVSLYGLVRIAFNVGQAIGRAMDISASLMVGAFLKAADLIRVDWADLLGTLQNVMDPLNLIPDFEFTTDLGDAATAAFENARSQATAFQGDLATIKDTTLAIIDGWAAVAAAVEAAKSTLAGDSGTIPDAVPGSGTGAGTGGAGAGALPTLRGNRGLLDPSRAFTPIVDWSEELRKTMIDNFSLASIWMKHFGDQVVESYDAVKLAGVDLAHGIGNAFADAALNGMESFTRLRDHVIAMLAQMAAKFAVFKLLGFFFPGSALTTAFGLSSGFLKSAPVARWPGRAFGGQVVSGRAYLVGERGPELFVPGGSGQVVSNEGLRRSGGGTVHLHLPPSGDPRLASRDRDFLHQLSRGLSELGIPVKTS